MKRHTLLWTIVLVVFAAFVCVSNAVAQEDVYENMDGGFQEPPDAPPPDAPPPDEPPADEPPADMPPVQDLSEEDVYEEAPVTEEGTYETPAYEPPSVMEEMPEEDTFPADVMDEEPYVAEGAEGVDASELEPVGEEMSFGVEEQVDEGSEELSSASDDMAELIELKPDDVPINDLVKQEKRTEGLISVTLDSVPLQDVVRMFARISGANIVSGTNLQGSVTVSLKDVEWQPALRTILDTANMTLIMKSPDIYSVVSKSEAAGAPVSIDTIKLDFTTVSNVLPIVQKMLVSSNASVASFPAANSIIVQEIAERLVAIKEMVARIDKPRPQVFIEAKFVELNDEAIKNLGINWSSLAGYTLTARELMWGIKENRDTETSRKETWEQFDNRVHLDGVNEAYDIDGIASTVFAGPNSYETRSVDGTIGRSVVDTIEQGQNVGLEISDTFKKTVADARTAILSAADFEVTLSALKEENGISVVSNPRVIVASGEMARIHVGRKDPNYVITDQPGVSPGTIVQKRSLSDKLPWIETGVKVDVLPTVNTESNITVRIIPELSRALTPARPGDIPPIITRTITSEFNLESGRTVAIGGLTSTEDRDAVTKIPLLGDIPLIGKYLFRHTHKEKKQEEVIIFVTVGLANPESLNTSAGIPSGGKLVHRYLSKEAISVEAESLPRKRR